MPRTLSLSTDAFSSDIFLPVRLSGAEHINDLFRYQLILKTPDLDSVVFIEQFGIKTPSASVDISSWLGQTVTVSIQLDGKEVGFSEVNNTFRQWFTKTVGKGARHISGIINSARYLYDQGRSSYYSIELVPFLSPATLRSNYKVYQHKTPIDILDEVLAAYPGTIDKRLEFNKPDRYPIRDFQVQYGETDFTYFARLCAEWGICYWFEHGADGHTLVLSDETSGHTQLPSEAYHQISYYPPNHKIPEEYLHSFNVTAQMVSGAFASADYDYARASAEISNSDHNTQPYPEAQKQGVATKVQNKEEQEATDIAPKALEIYEYAADVVQPEAGPNQDGGNASGEQVLRNRWNLERLQQQHLSATASGHIRGIATGYTFTLEKHPNKLTNIQWTITSTELLIMDLAEETQRQATDLPSLLEGNNALSKTFIDGLTQKISKLTGNNNQQWLIECNAELIPANIPARPQAIAKPKATLQNALVVGEAGGGSLYTDSYGRIKVQMKWDRVGTKDQNSSCWVRVNEPWAGNQMGAVFTPRIGQEVLIDFINNDPDLPICMGKVNNSDNMPNWALAQNKALSGFRSRELPEGNSAGGRSNHLVFDDTEGKIQTQVKSDHAHSQLSLGDITRIEGNAGRKDARGQGFELRTDDWGSARAGKGLYLTTFPRESAASTHMDAFEAQQLLEEAQQLVKQLSKLANQHQAEPLSGTDPLDLFSKLTGSELPQHPDIGMTNTVLDNIMGKGGFNLDSLTNQIDETNALKSVLPDGLPNEVKAKATEDILKNLAKQEAIPPIQPIVDAGKLHYNGAMEIYKSQLKAFENNPYDKARQKLEELNSTTANPKEKMEKLLNDKGIEDIFSSLKADGKSQSQLQGEMEAFSPKGFEENVLVGAGEAGIALVTPADTHQYSALKHTVTAGQDLNITTGQSWLASVYDKMSFFVQQGVKIFSGKGKIQIQAQTNELELLAQKVAQLISTQDWVEIIGKKGVFIKGGDSYIKICSDGIEHGTPGQFVAYAANHSLVGPRSISYDFPDNPSETYDHRFVVKDKMGKVIPSHPYKIKREDGSYENGITDKEGKTHVVFSSKEEKIELSLLNKGRI